MTDLPLFDLLRVSLWFVAGLIALSFSIGSTRIWTSISTGFFLVFISEGYLVAPWVEHATLMALHSVAGTVAALVITHGVMEYYVFSRTLEVHGSKAAVYAGVAGVLLGSVAFMFINPSPTPDVVHHVRVVENTCWTFLAVINLDLLRKIYAQVKDTPIGPGFLALGAVFSLIFLWRGAMLYLQVYGWEPSPQGSANVEYLVRVTIASNVNRFASMLSSIGAGATFLWLARALR